MRMLATLGLTLAMSSCLQSRNDGELPVSYDANACAVGASCVVEVRQVPRIFSDAMVTPVFLGITLEDGTCVLVEATPLAFREAMEFADALDDATLPSATVGEFAGVGKALKDLPATIEVADECLERGLFVSSAEFGEYIY